MSERSNIVGILEGGRVDEALTRSIIEKGLPAMRFGSVESLSRYDSLPSLSVFVFPVNRVGLGPLLIALGYLTHEYPSVRKLAVVEDRLSVVLATYLSTCAVDFLMTGFDPSGVDCVASTVRRIADQGLWCVHRASPECGDRWSQEVRHA